MNQQLKDISKHKTVIICAAQIYEWQQRTTCQKVGQYVQTQFDNTEYRIFDNLASFWSCWCWIKEILLYLFAPTELMSSVCSRCCAHSQQALHGFLNLPNHKFKSQTGGLLEYFWWPMKLFKRSCEYGPDSMVDKWKCLIGQDLYIFC